MNSAASPAPVDYITFSISAALVCLSCLVYMFVRRRYDMLQSKLFIALIIDLVITSVANVLFITFNPQILMGGTPEAIVRISNYIYFVAHAALAMLFWLYVQAVCGVSLRRKLTQTLLLGVPFIITEIFALVNPLTQWVYYYDANMVFTRNWAVYCIYAAGMFYFALGMYSLLRSWRAITRRKRRALSYFFIMACSGVVVQMLIPEIQVELFAESLAAMGVVMFIENEEDLTDFEVDVYNRRALSLDCKAYLKTGSPYCMIALRIMNADALLQLGGSASLASGILVRVADYLKTLMPRYRIYRVSPSVFALIDPDINENKASSIADMIVSRFKHSWEYNDMEVNLSAAVAFARVPEDFNTVESILYLLDAPAPRAYNGSVLKGSDLGFFIRRAEVERAVQQGFDNNGYEVYYQPVFGLDGRVHSAEALMRLSDSSLGSVPPIEFIEAAERTGDIEKIGDFALQQVCAFLASGIPARLGVERISVNLSIIQCMQANFSSHVESIVVANNARPDSITFEITESIAAGDYDFLDGEMLNLKENGHRFAMDDYGTGYSNMHSLLKLDFDVVKVDKSVLWDAEKSAAGMNVLSNSVNMLHSIGCSVLVEGVETETQVRTLRRLGVDYYQGYYYAKPMPRDEFVEFLKAC